jgi:hypothetical protein
LKLYLLPDQRRFPDHQNKLLMMQKKLSRDRYISTPDHPHKAMSSGLALTTTTFFVLLPICQRTRADYPDAYMISADKNLV